MGNQLASLIIPSRGGATRLPVLLSALAAQTYEHWEAVVVLDGDIDESESVVELYSHLPVRVVVFPENRGRVAALNAGHDAARGDILIRCDDDLRPKPDFVAAHVAQHVADDSAAIGLTHNVLPNNYYARAYGNDADKLHRKAAYNSTSPWRHWAGNVSLTRSLWERMGPYDRAYRTYGWEDVDFGFRLHLAGVRLRIVPELETDHLAAATTCSIRVTRAFHSGAALHTFLTRYEDALPPPTATDRSLWSSAVQLAGRFGSRRTLETLAQFVDWIGPALPRPIARKAIALLAEAATVSGYRRHQETSSDV